MNTYWLSKTGCLLCLGLLAFSFMHLGCSRTKYRRAADAESYELVASRQIDSRWQIPARPVEPQATSRMHLGSNIDCGPQPQDDPAANQFMNCPDGHDNSRYYSQIPTRGNTENPIWLDYLPRDESGQIQLTQRLALDLALLHSRDFQTQFEGVYLSALGLTGNRFEFETQWFGGGGALFTATGQDLGDQRLLSVSDRLGFARNLAGGGQFATSILNSLFWDFGTGSIQGGSGSIVSTFTQPLLRGAFRYVRLETLTQAERNLLYAVREFARFRRTFYFDVTSDYLSLLTQVQAIRNLRTNVENLRLSLDEYELYAEQGNVSTVEVDQVYQNYQSGRLRLIAAEQSLAESLDRFKFQLGLPPWVPFEIDESPLAPFELVDPQLESMQTQAQELYEALVQYLPPERAPAKVLVEGFERYVVMRDQLATILPKLEGDLELWLNRINDSESAELSQDDRLDVQQQRVLAQRIQKGLLELRENLERRQSEQTELWERLQAYSTNQDVLPAPTPEAPTLETPQVSADAEELLDPSLVAWQSLVDAVGDGLRQEIAEIFVAQTQVRLFLIDIDLIDIEEKTAIVYAHRNRLDLMNRQAQAMDAFRRVEVAADALEADLDLRGDVILGTDPSKNNAFRLDSSANTYRVGVELDGPLNRLNERNVYRARQIEYQQASRNFVAGKDQVANEIRSVLRQLKLRRLNFQIARQQIVAATRQVDQAQIDVRTGGADGGGDSNLTIFLLQALQGLLDAKNDLISNWISYRIEKIRLFTALELLYLDESGQWINEVDGLQALDLIQAIDSEYFPTQSLAPSPVVGYPVEAADEMLLPPPDAPADPAVP